MKAKVVTQVICEGVLDFVHGGGYPIKRLVVEERGNLAITLHNKEMLVWPNFDIKDQCEIVGEVEVPDEMVEKAVALVRAKADLNEFQDTFKSLVGKK